MRARIHHPVAEAIERQIQQDPGGRGIEQWGCREELLPATLSLMRGRHVVITTGFYIAAAGAIETDGPPGAIILATALQKLGKRVTLLVDDHAARIMARGLDVMAASVETVATAPGAPIAPDSLFQSDTTHFLAIERAGRSADGRYYNFAGRDITAHVAPVDDLFEEARETGIVTIGIGDGGNELGMRRVAEAVDRHLAVEPPISCSVDADYCICAGVSNWGGYGMTALLSRLTGERLLPPLSRLNTLLAAIVDAGAVDGISARRRPTVDGLKPAWEREIYQRMRRLSAA